MIWSCRLFKLNPEFDAQTKTVLEARGSAPVYAEFQDMKLSMFVSDVAENEYGKFVTLGIDNIVWLYDRERGNYPNKVTDWISLQLFETQKVSNYLGVFASKQATNMTWYAIFKAVGASVGRTAFPLQPMKFMLREHEADLRKNFGNLQQIGVDEIRDTYVSGAVIKGQFLESSPEYEKYVLDQNTGGRLVFFGVTLPDGRVVVISTDATIWTRKGIARYETKVVHDLFSVLLDNSAVMS